MTSSSSNAKLDAVVSKMKAQATHASPALSPPPPLSSVGPAGKSGAALTKDTNDALARAIQMSERTNDLGSNALTSLGKQGELIRHSITTVEETTLNLRDSRRTLRDMRLQYWKDKLGKALIITCLLLIIFFIVYEKWIKKLRS